MNPQNLLSQAARNLRLAAQARQQEVKDLEQLLTRRLQDQENELRDLKKEEGTRLEEAAEANDNATTANKNQQARMLRAEESKIKSAHDQMKRETDQLIQIKRRNIDEINHVAQQVEQWSNM